MKVLAQRICTEGPYGDEPNAVLVTVLLYEEDVNFILDSHVIGEPVTNEVAQTIASQIVDAVASIE